MVVQNWQCSLLSSLPAVSGTDRQLQTLISSHISILIPGEGQSRPCFLQLSNTSRQSVVAEYPTVTSPCIQCHPLLGLSQSQGAGKRKFPLFHSHKPSQPRQFSDNSQTIPQLQDPNPPGHLLSWSPQTQELGLSPPGSWAPTLQDGAGNADLGMARQLQCGDKSQPSVPLCLSRTTLSLLSRVPAQAVLSGRGSAVPGGL